MVVASHVIFCMYGFWLPNDPRGSWSDFVGAWELLRFGDATKTDTRRSVAAAPHDSDQRRRAKASLKFPPLSLTGIQARAVARGFANYIKLGNIRVHACSILPDHVHMVIARHDFHVEQIVNLLKGAATKQLRQEHLDPPSGCWAVGQWKVFLDSAADIGRAIRYVNDNPMKEFLPAQRWRFITPV